MKERFKYGRTVYGLFIIASFLVLTALAVIVALNVWGWHVGFEDIISWLRKSIYSYTHPTTGRHIDVNMLHLIRVFFYVIGGIVVAYLIK